MKNKIIGLSAIALSMSLAQAPLAYASHDKCFGGASMEKMSEKLDLTADQKTKIEAIRMQVMPQIKAKQDEMRATHMEINELFKASTLDESKLDSLITKQQDVFGAILKIRLMERRDIAAVLTDAQKAKLAEMIQKHENKHQEIQADHESD